MSKKPRLGRNMNALLGGATRNRREEEDSSPVPTPASTATTSPTASPATSSMPSEAVSAKMAPPEADTAEPATVRSYPPASSKPDSTLSEIAPAHEAPPSEESASSRTESDTNTANPIHPVAMPPSSVESPGSRAAPREAPETVSELAPETVSVAASTPHLRSVSSASNSNALTTEARSGAGGDVLRKIGIDLIRRGAWQPRRTFDQELLQELADSLVAQGMIQPVLVRPFANGAYELIAGERRWRAAQLAGMQEIPALVRDMEDQRVAAVSLIENIQRKDLNPLEEAQAFERLCDDFGMTHKAVAESVGRSRASVSNLMRLLELHDEVKVMVDKGLFEMGHARALLGAPVEQQPELANRIISQGLTVRAVEKLIRDQQSGKPAPATSGSDRVSDPDIDRLSRKLGDLLGTSVDIRHKTSGAGRLEISYTSVTELEGILEHIK